MMQATRPALVMMVLFTILLGLLYPLALTGAGRSVQAQGANLLQNPSFEAGFYTFDPDDYNWVALYSTQRADCRTRCVCAV